GIGSGDLRHGEKQINAAGPDARFGPDLSGDRCLLYRPGRSVAVSVELDRGWAWRDHVLDNPLCPRRSKLAWQDSNSGAGFRCNGTFRAARCSLRESTTRA